tara:strand:- start:663 stop:977 length:315 start_codon:yes stop_codon:yes gene_type:complete
MALRKYERVQSQDPTINKVQERLERAFIPLFGSLIIDGVLIEDLSLNTSTLEIPHGLGRPYRGYFVADLNADARVYRDTSSASNPSQFLPLKASGAVTAKVWVF